MAADVTPFDRDGVRSHLAKRPATGALKNTRNMHLHPLNLCIGEAKAAASPAR
jgi:glycine/D-amino acid oxidase-like deaminating enzyme